MKKVLILDLGDAGEMEVFVHPAVAASGEINFQTDEINGRVRKIGDKWEVESLFSKIDQTKQFEKPTARIVSGRDWIEQKIAEGIGMGSIAWSEVPSGVFLAEKANEIVRRLMSDIERIFPEAALDLKKTVLKTDLLPKTGTPFDEPNAFNPETEKKEAPKKRAVEPKNLPNPPEFYKNNVA